MKSNPLYPSLSFDLAPDEIQALQHIKNGRRISAAQRTRLESLDLIKPQLNGWALTDIGAYRLTAQES
jgi:hypothetical protein